MPRDHLPSAVSRPFLRRLAAAVLPGLLLTAACTSKPSAPAPAPSPPGPPAGPPLFADVTATSGVQFTYHNGEETAGHRSILETLGGGVALLDYDGDGLLDIFLTGGGHYTGPDKKDIAGLPCKLYRNLGGGKFEDVTAAAGLDRLAGGRPWFYTHGCAVADYDRDGWPDLLVTGWGRLALFRNVPDGKGGRRFEDVTAAAGLDQGIYWATSVAFGDLDGDGYPDLYVCQYVNWSWDNHPPCNYDGTMRDVCPPKVFDGLRHKVYRNTGAGRFVDVSAEAGLAPGGRDSSKGLGVLLVDLDGDGKPDVYVCNDTTDKFLYLNRSTPGKIRLREAGLDTGAARDQHGSANGSMGVDAGDYDGSGKPALWVTNYEHEQHGLYRNEVRPGLHSFTFQTAAAGLARMDQKYVGWGTAFLDVDLDGWEDLFVANGHVIHYQPGEWVGRKQPPVLYRNLGGKFEEVSRQIGSYHGTGHVARGVGFGDLDNDGRVDLVISHVNEPAAVLRGVGGEGRHWLGVQLAGKGHADVVGSKVELQAGDRLLTRFAKGGGSYLSSGDRRQVFGLGEQTQPGRLTVTWPDGTKQHFDGLSADRYYRVTQGQAQAEPLPAR
ncbi:MAG TPA: CRTAC1 family protein [Gemmataceae bacterium]|nr:CRTAC1 family protein [Gemmataceae bacterium]